MKTPGESPIGSPGELFLFPNVFWTNPAAEDRNYAKGEQAGKERAREGEGTGEKPGTKEKRIEETSW